MRKKIRKTLTFTRIECSEILVENGCISTKELGCIEEVGDYTLLKPEKIVGKYYKGKNVVITKLDTYTQIREMDLQTFINNSQIIETNEQLEKDLGGK